MQCTGTHAFDIPSQYSNSEPLLTEMPSANPLLIPHDILLKLKALPMMEDFDTGSISFRPGFHAERLKFLDVNSPVGPDTIFAGGAGDRLQTQVRHTYLHIACLSGDAPLFCEMIRKGASVDLQDTNGYTGLLLALESLLSCQMALHANSPLSKKASALRSRQEYIARVLIEQHADVNHSVNGLTPLHLVCRAQNWDLIALLLKHGANPTLASSLQGSPSMLLSSSTDRSRFSALVKESPPCNARPARMCPCFSGQPIAACHAANALPYPPSLLCPCASGKSYEKCCARRKMIMVEEWDEKNGCIVASSIRSISLPEMSKHQEKLRDNIEGVMVAKEFSDLLRKIEPGHHYKDLDGESCLKMALRFQEKSTDELLKKGLMDPAYAYALKQLEFSPRSGALLCNYSTFADTMSSDHKAAL